MNDLLQVVGLIAASLGFLCLLRDVPARRRDPASTALAVVFFLSALSFVFSIAPTSEYMDRVLGAADLSVLLAQSCVIALIACQQVVLTYWSAPPDVAPQRARSWLGAGLVVIVGLALLFALLTLGTANPVDVTLFYADDNLYIAYLTLYATAYMLGQLFLARASWRLASRSNRAAVCVGLRIVALGAAVTLGFSAVNISNVVAGAFDGSLAAWENFAWICRDVGAVLTMIGCLVPTITDHAQSIQYRIKQYRSYNELRPLWLAFYSEAPEIELLVDPAQRRRFRRISIRLYRRAVEIRDGRFVIRPYLDPALREASEDHHRARGLCGQELAAAVTADQILAGIAARAEGARPAPDQHTDFADAERRISRPLDDLDALLDVARHLPRQPACTRRLEQVSA
ncbi:MAB_1171c family putative transporter [Streptomyces sp. NPDC088387]|uniref:MAB_1171c family putative transporter n=1 Tax=Streptomyces sp. NPDC088387 TaxID=3365859 RepID=UPI003826EFBC